MRLLTPGKVKFFLLIVFLYNVGFFSFLGNTFHEVSEDLSQEMPEEEGRARQEILTELLEQRVVAAEAKLARGEVYTPRNYFKDLRDLKVREFELDVNHCDHYLITQLQILMAKNEGKGFSNYDLGIAAKEFNEYSQQGSERGRRARLAFDEKIRRASWWGVAKSVFKFFYLENILLAFVLMLVWFREENEDETAYPHPLKFFLLLLLYPFHFAKIFAKWLAIKRDVLIVEAELRQTKKNMFVRLSHAEVERIRQFSSENLSISAWRQWLAEQGLQPKHSLAAALAATVILTMLPKLALADEEKDNQLAISQVVVTKQCDNHHLPRMDINDADNGGGGHYMADRYCLAMQGELWFRPTARRLIAKALVFCPQEVVNTIQHIPIRLIMFNGCVSVSSAN